MVRKYLVLGLIHIASFAGAFAHAQVRSTDIVLGLSPEFPSPNQSVTATLSSYATNLDKANISWSVNNQEMGSGIGKKVFSFNTGNLCSPLSLNVLINTIDGQSVQKTISLTPADVDMLWEANDSYVPPFYKGKTLASNQGSFKVVAIPSLINKSGKVNKDNLSYVWTKDRSVQSNSSGWGKNYFIFQHSYLDKENVVEVKISDITGEANATGTVRPSISSPKIVFYENDPALCIEWGRAVENISTVSQAGEVFIAEPYFFSPKNITAPELVFNWFVNEAEVQTSNSKNILSVKPEAGQSGNAIIKVIVENTKTLFQEAEKEINVTF